MAQSYLVLVCLWAVMFSLGDGQGGGDVSVDGQLEGENFGSFICQQKCSDQEGEGVRQVRDDTLFDGNHFGSCVCQQSCSGQGTITEDRMEAMLREMASSFEIKMAATTNKVESLQQTVDQLIQRTVTEDRMEVMFERMVSSIEIKMAATTNTVDGPQETVTQPTQDVRSGCPMDFVFNLQANICFKLYREFAGRADASTACQNLPGLNARLVVLDTPEKVQLVQEHLSAHYHGNFGVWIGGRREDNEGPLLWETGQEVTGPWHPGQPDNNGGNQDCLAIVHSPSSSGCLLFDTSCSGSGPYICEH